MFVTVCVNEQYVDIMAKEKEIAFLKGQLSAVQQRNIELEAEVLERTQSDMFAKSLLQIDNELVFEGEIDKLKQDLDTVNKALQEALRESDVCGIRSGKLMTELKEKCLENEELKATNDELKAKIKELKQDAELGTAVVMKCCEFFASVACVKPQIDGLMGEMRDIEDELRAEIHKLANNCEKLETCAKNIAQQNEGMTTDYRRWRSQQQKFNKKLQTELLEHMRVVEGLQATLRVVMGKHKPLLKAV